jgi:hypothetical protein
MHGNRALRAIFGLRRDEMKGGWTKLHSRELQALYCSPDIVRLIKSRRMRWARHVADMGDKAISVFWWEKLQLKDLGLDGGTVLKWILQT